MLYYYDMGMTAKDVIKILKKNGWILKRIKGSHHIFIKDNKSLAVPVHKNIDIGVFAKQLLKEAGITEY